MNPVCPRCGKSFGCGMEENGANTPCWCTQLPPLSARQLKQLQTENPEARCFCPDCLRAALDAGRKAS